MIEARVMVVEDERIVALHIRQQLEKLGYEVPVVVSSGEQALEKIGTNRPDLILMDIRIDGNIDGIETASRIPPELNIPVIYLTAYSEEATLARARATTPHGYLLKPFSERELHATIQMAMQRNNAEIARHEADERLHQAQKLEAIGQLAGGVAHDFNNLLAIIQGNLELIQERAPDAKVAALISDALTAAQRGATLTQQLLAYSRRQRLLPQVLNIPVLVEELAGLLRRLLGETIEIQTRMPQQMWNIRVDQQQLESALINLAVNARDAMPGGGTLAIEGTNQHLAEPREYQQTSLEPGPYATITVSDSGTGMTEDVARMALEPFFTTKPPGKGTGLGLSQVFGFVRQSRGAMQIRNRPEGGASVELLFPALPGQRATAHAAAGKEVLPRAQGNVVILLVEDDTMVRRSISLLLASLGYHTLEAEDGHAACSILATDVVIDLLLTDFVLPKGMDGAQLVEEAMRLRPTLKVLFMSGYPATEQDPGATVCELIQKPFSRQALATRLQALLGATPALDRG